MIINYKNASIINSNEFCIHDDYKCDLHFDWASGDLVFRCQKFTTQDFYEMKFHDVVDISFSNCDFWGGSRRIDCIVFLENDEQILLPKIKRKYAEVGMDGELVLAEHFELLIAFVSGDTLRIACKSVDVDDLTTRSDWRK